MKRLFIALILFSIVFSYTVSASEEIEEIECWIMCQPDSWVYARIGPKKKSSELGRLECGDMIYTDGKTKNGYLHVYGLPFEAGEGWVHKGYIVYDQPYKPDISETVIISNGRVKARKTIGGNRRCWLKNGQKIKVYMMSSKWAVTNKGFVKSEFISH